MAESVCNNWEFLKGALGETFSKKFPPACFQMLPKCCKLLLAISGIRDDKEGGQKNGAGKCTDRSTDVGNYLYGSLPTSRARYRTRFARKRSRRFG